MANDKVSFYVMGKKYEIPKGLTIMGAMEEAGYQYIRGCGCRGGFCGACATVYRTADDYRLKVGLACQTTVEDGMYLTQIPFYPANKATYDIEQVQPSAEHLMKFYPELSRCLACGTCNRACPQDLKVCEYMQAAIRGDIARVADLSFDCIMCGLCASRCPAEEVQYLIAILARRMYGKYVAPKAPHLQDKMKELSANQFDNEIDKMMKTPDEELRKMYADRDMEPK
jgi:ferredoxin